MITPTHLFVHVVDVDRPNHHLDAGRAPKIIYEPHLEDVPCRIVPRSSQKQLRAMQEGEIATHDMFCDIIDITVHDRVTFGGVNYEVTGVINPDEIDVFMRIGLRKTMVQ